MTDSIRQQIIDALDLRLRDILVAGGYKRDIGTHVFAWRDTEASPFSATELPGLNYKDRTESRTPGCGIYELTLPIEISLYDTSPANIRKCLADIEKAVFVDETWGGLALNSEIDTDETEVEQKENIFSASHITLTVEYRTLRGDPLTQG